MERLDAYPHKVLQLAACSQIINTARIIENLHAYPPKVLQLAACHLQPDYQYSQDHRKITCLSA